MNQCTNLGSKSLESIMRLVKEFWFVLLLYVCKYLTLCVDKTGLQKDQLLKKECILDAGLYQSEKNGDMDKKGLFSETLKKTYKEILLPH